MPCTVLISGLNLLIPAPGPARFESLQAIKDGYLFSRAKYVVNEELHCPPPSIRVAVSAAHTAQELQAGANVLSLALKSVTSRLGAPAPRRS